jgi:MerR family transcriptional regulator, copper efflux regulator
MRIGEVAKRSGLSTSRIRYYEANALIPKAERDDNGYRKYPASIVEMLRLIDGAQQLGFSLNEIREGLAQADNMKPSLRDLLKALRHKRASLDQHIREALMRRQKIDDLIAKYENGNCR